MRSLKTLMLALSLTSALPMFGAIYIKFDGVDGSVTAAGHEKWIELASVENADGTPMKPVRIPTPGAGLSGMLDQGRVRISSSSLVAELGPLCQSRRPLGDVLVDVGGERYVLRNARFAECPVLRGGVATAVLEYGATSTPQRGNATISGIARTPLPMDIRRALLNGNLATVYLKAGTVTEALGKAIIEATAKGTVIPVLVIESAGQQWSFTKVIFTSASVSQGQDPVFTFQFETMNGSAAAFQSLGN